MTRHVRLVSRLGALAAAAVLAFAAPAGAQSSSAVAAADSAYLASTGEGSVYEADVALLGLEKATSPMVREYAQALVLDHGMFNVELMSLANDLGVVVPVQPNAADRAKLDGLRQRSGPAFDAAFLAEEARVNAQDVADETKASAATSNAELAAFIKEIEPGDRFHLALAKSLATGSLGSP